MPSCNRCEKCPTAEALAIVLGVAGEVTDYALDHPQAPSAALLDYAQGFAPDALRRIAILLTRVDRGQVQNV